jgi:uncharacterized Zn-binding protein involved in type VI secretion
MGPGISGSTNVIVNGRPALRVNDRGIHAACCGGNTWTAQAGSATVFINGQPAHRLGDMTMHCGGIGQLAEGSSDVFVGDSTAAGVPQPSIGTLSVPKAAAPGVPFVLQVGLLDLPRFVTDSIAEVIWTIDGKVCPGRGRSVTITLGKEYAGRDVAVTADLGVGSPRARAMLAVPKLALEGPDTVEIDEEIHLRAKVTPAVEGTYRWTDSDGKSLGEGREIPFVGKVRSKTPGDQPVECRFSSKQGGVVLTERHPITVVKIPRLKLPISISLRGLAETVRWVRDNAMEVLVDGVAVGSHAMVEGPGRIVVSFSAPEGEHAVIISSAASSYAAGRAPIRLVHFSAKVKVTVNDQDDPPPSARRERPEAADDDRFKRLGSRFTPPKK